jgi:signal transduction histidine kinase
MTAEGEFDAAMIEQREYRLDQVRLLTRNIPVIIVANLVNSLLTMAFFRDVAPTWILVAWLTLSAILASIGGRGWWRHRTAPSPNDVAPSVIRRITLCAGLGGGLWGLFALILFPADSVSHQVLLALVVGSMAAASLVGLQSIPLASASYILLSLTPLIACFGGVGDSLHWFMTEMLTAFAVVLIALSHNSHVAFMEGVRLRLRNAELMTQTDGMNRALRRHVQELEWSRARLIQQARDLQELAQANGLERQRAETANRAKSIFLANMSHELRTPLNAIIGFSDMMRTEALGPVGSARYRSYADDINLSGMHLLGLINDLLDLSKIEAGKMRLIEDLVDIGHLVDDCLLLVRDAAERADIELVAEVPRALPAVYADERKLKQILINLCGNAVKFTPERGTVRIAALVEPSGCLAIRVSDSGIGIKPEDIARVLEPFGQLDGAPPREQSGTGLELPLSKMLAELHGGELEIHGGVGTGTTVLLRLPRERVRRSAIAVA